jgi:NAD(P)-dependent dehydrogenase (short-subunit alcohol dehydrogenase family)
VTGSNRGLGFEIARQLARKGLDTIVTGRDPRQAEQAAAVLRGEGLSVSARTLDVADDESVSRLAVSLAPEPGRLDVLVNNAGISGDASQSPSAIDLEDLHRTFETNFFGAWRMAKVAIPLMRRHGYGRIVNVSSGMGSLTEPSGAMWPAYCTSKTALNSLTRVLAAELDGENILVNSACPGWVRTSMGGKGAPLSPEEGADTPVWLATLEEGGPTGGFFRNRRPAAW